MKINSTHDVAAAARGRRLQLGLSQAEVAARAGVSRPWINMFEAGKPTVELALVLRLLDALDLRLDLVPEPETTGTPSPDETVDLDALLARLHDLPPVLRNDAETKFDVDAILDKHRNP